MDQSLISVLIVEDEPTWMLSLKKNLTALGFAISGTADNFESAVGAMNTLDFDIALLDIHLNGRNSGIELGRMLSTLYKKPFVFVSANSDSDTLAAAVQAKPFGFLPKPVHNVSLFVTLQSALQNFNDKVSIKDPAGWLPSTGSFYVKVGEKYKKIHWNDIVYLASEKNYTALFNSADKTTYYIRSTLSKTLHYVIPPAFKDHFVQVNRSEAVNTLFVKEMDNFGVTTAFRRFPVTEAFNQGLRKHINMIA